MSNSGRTTERTTAPHSSAGRAPVDAPVTRLQRMTVMTSVVLVMLVAGMDTTILNTTMPRIASALGGQEWYAWTFTSYMIFTTVMTPIAGRLADLFGRKRVFVAGMLVFLAGSLLCGFAGSTLQLVVYRAVQGAGAGLVAPFPPIIAGDLYPVEQRGKIQALFSAMWGLSAVLAPLLGSVLMEHAGWRWIFWVNLPICLISLLFLLAYPEAYRPKQAKVDTGGALLFSAGIVLALLVTVELPGQIWYGAAGAAILALFFLYERRHPSPLLPLGLFGDRQLRWITVNAFASTAALFGTSSFVPMFLQMEGYSLFASGAVLIGMSAGWMAASVPSGKWILKYGYARLIVTGNALLVASGAMLLFLRPGTGLLYVGVTMFVLGLAFGLLATVGTIGAQQLVGPHDKGVSTSLQLFARNVGTAVGVAVMGGLFNRAGDPYTGIAHLFQYGAAAAVVALLSSLPMLKRTFVRAAAETGPDQA